MSDTAYTVVLTSCGRFSLLEETIRTFLQHADVPPAEFIVIEDSGDAAVQSVLDKFDHPFQLIINSPPLGQDRAIDKAYQLVKTPLVFHCEDDWRFIRGGFIRESAALLQAFPSASGIMLRGREEYSDEFDRLPAQTHEGVSFFIPPRTLHKKFWGYSYNPGLRRLADFRKVAPVAKIGNEREISYVFKRLGYTTIHLEKAAVVHTGEEQTTRQRRRKSMGDFLLRRIRRNFCIAKHLILQKFQAGS